MPLRAKCGSCSRVYNLAEEMAGKTVRCRDCQATFVVKVASTDMTARAPASKLAAATAPPKVRRHGEFRDVDEVPRKSRRVRSDVDHDEVELDETPRRSKTAKPQQTGFAAWPYVLMGIGIYWLVGIGVMLLSPFAGNLWLVVGFVALVAIGNIVILVIAFQEDVVCGLLCLFVPFYGLYYLWSRYERTWRPFHLCVYGGVMLATAMVINMFNPMGHVKPFGEHVAIGPMVEHGGNGDVRQPEANIPQPNVRDDGALAENDFRKVQNVERKAPRKDVSIEKGQPVDLFVGDILPPYIDAVIGSDSTALLAYSGGTLKRIRLPIAKELNSYRLSQDPYRMVLDTERGVLYAICAKLQVKNEGVRRDERRGLYDKGDLYVFDVREALNGQLQNGARLTPKHMVPVGGTVSTLLLSPDGAWVYFMDIDNNRLGRVNTATARLEGVFDQLDPMTEAICLTPDGTTLYAAAHEGKYDHYNSGPFRGTVKKIDTSTFTIEKSVVVNIHPQDIRARDDHMVFLSSGSGQHVGCTAVDMNTGEQKNRWCVSPGSDMLCLSADQRTLFVNHGWHGSAHLHAVPLPSALTDRAERDVQVGPGDNYAARREMRMSPDGQFLLLDSGRIIRVEPKGAKQGDERIDRNEIRKKNRTKVSKEAKSIEVEEPARNKDLDKFLANIRTNPRAGFTLLQRQPNEAPRSENSRMHRDTIRQTQLPAYPS
jgi:DNA-directed RNA polymerase subunit RPC12/RpoP